MRIAFDRIAAELAAGELVCIFPEGKLTGDGELAPFRPGIERILERTPVPVVPMAIRGMWGSFFSRQGGKQFRRPFRRVWSRIELVIGEPIAPAAVSAAGLAERVAALGGFAPPADAAPACEGSSAERQAGRSETRQSPRILSTSGGS